MVRKFSKVGVLFLALVLALAGIGAAFAGWTDTLTLSGTVNTGCLDMEIDHWTILDESGPGEAPPYDYLGGVPDKHLVNPLVFPGATQDDPDGKNVGWANGTLIEPGILKVDLNNVYPCYYNAVSVYPISVCSIPVKIWKAIITWGNATGQLGEDTIYESTVLTLDLSGNGVPDFEISYGDHFGTQLHDGDPANKEISFELHVMQDEGDVQGQSFWFTIEIVGIQWNEYPN